MTETTSDVRTLPTRKVPVTELQPGDLIWVERKVRGSFSRDMMGVVKTAPEVIGRQAFFDYVQTLPVQQHLGGLWHSCTSAEAIYEVVVFP